MHDGHDVFLLLITFLSALTEDLLLIDLKIIIIGTEMRAYQWTVSGGILIWFLNMSTFHSLQLITNGCCITTQRYP